MSYAPVDNADHDSEGIVMEERQGSEPGITRPILPTHSSSSSSSSSRWTLAGGVSPSASTSHLPLTGSGTRPTTGRRQISNTSTGSSQVEDEEEDVDESDPTIRRTKTSRRRVYKTYKTTSASGSTGSGEADEEGRGESARARRDRRARIGFLTKVKEESYADHPNGWSDLFKASRLLSFVIDRPGRLIQTDVPCPRPSVQWPVVKQWTHEGRLYKDASERAPSRFELFFDLLYVGIVHQLAENVIQDATWANVGKFVLTFYPSWTIWIDVRNFLNVSGVDDIPQRLYILTTMILMVGYSSNAAGIDFVLDGTAPHGIEPAQHSSPASNATEPSAPHMSLYGRFNLIPRSGLLVGRNAEPEAINNDEISAKCLVAALSFFLVAKVMKLFITLFYAWALPSFRIAHLIQALSGFIIAASYSSLVWANPWTLIALPIVATIIDQLFGWMTVQLAKIDTRRRKLGRKALFGSRNAIGIYIPAKDPEHFLERNSGMVILVLGEMIINAFYSATEESLGLSPHFGKAAFGLIIAFDLNWLFFYSEFSTVYVHALRRHWFSALLFTHLHWPLVGTLVIAGSSMSQMILSHEVVHGLRWYFGGGIGNALLIMAILGAMHKPILSEGERRWKFYFRVGLRLIVAALLIASALVDISNFYYLLMIMGTLTLLVIVETISKLKRRSGDVDEFDELDDDDEYDDKADAPVQERESERPSTQQQAEMSEVTTRPDVPHVHTALLEDDRQPADSMVSPVSPARSTTSARRRRIGTLKRGPAPHTPALDRRGIVNDETRAMSVEMGTRVEEVGEISHGYHYPMTA